MLCVSEYKTQNRKIKKMTTQTEEKKDLEATQTKTTLLQKFLASIKFSDLKFCISAQ